MYLTMNRFPVKVGQEETFEQVWKTRNSYLPEVPGFAGFHLFKGEEKDGVRLYASHTLWNSEEDFRAWTKSEAFRAAHSGAGNARDAMAGHPQLEVFTSVHQVNP